MSSEYYVVRRGSKHDIEMLDIHDEYINGEAGEDQDKGLTAAERYENEGVAADDLDDQRLLDIKELVPPGNTQGRDVFRILDLPREIRDNVCTLNGCYIIQRWDKFRFLTFTDT